MLRVGGLEAFYGASQALFGRAELTDLDEGTLSAAVGETKVAEFAGERPTIVELLVAMAEDELERGLQTLDARARDCAGVPRGAAAARHPVDPRLPLDGLGARRCPKTPTSPRRRVLVRARCARGLGRRVGDDFERRADRPAVPVAVADPARRDRRLRGPVAHGDPPVPPRLSDRRSACGRGHPASGERHRGPGAGVARDDGPGGVHRLAFAVLGPRHGGVGTARRPAPAVAVAQRRTRPMKCASPLDALRE